MKNCVDGSTEKRFMKPQTQRALFNRNSDNKSGHPLSRCQEKERSSSSVVLNNAAEDNNCNKKDCSENLSVIRDQLVQIEERQANLLNLSQRFMGSSQDGIRSLESRINGLELALNEISRDLAVSSGRITTNGKASCFPLHAATFLNSKFKKLTGGCCYSISKPPSSATAQSKATSHHFNR